MSKCTARPSPASFHILTARCRNLVSIVAGCLLLCLSSQAQPQSQNSNYSLNKIFWFHDPVAADAFLRNPPKGATGISVSGTNAQKQAQADLAHSKGLAVLSGLPGSILPYGHTYDGAIQYIEHIAIDPMVAQKVDIVYVDEPLGPSLNDAQACGPGCYVPGQPPNPKAISWVVNAYNTLFDYLKARLPNAKTGICLSSVQFHLMTLAGGLRADFVCMESYGASLPKHFSAIKATYPKIQTMYLAYGTRSLCQNSDVVYVDMWDFWDSDNYSLWVPTPLIDDDWLTNAKLFASGDSSFCTKPYSLAISPWTWATQKANFTLAATDYQALVWPPPHKLSRCEYKVKSNGIETVPWTSRPCSGKFPVTIGKMAACRDKGKLSCIVYLRAIDSVNEYGDTEGMRFNIDY